MKEKVYLAIDQYGGKYVVRGAPRKALLEVLGRRHADKMYQGEGEHIGWIIGGLWLHVYQLSPMKGGK